MRSTRRVGAGGKLTPLRRLKMDPVWGVGGGVRGSWQPGSVVSSRPGEGVVLDVERWAELRREHFVRGSRSRSSRGERDLRVTRSGWALRSQAPPRYERPGEAVEARPVQGGDP